MVADSASAFSPAASSVGRSENACQYCRAALGESSVFPSPTCAGAASGKNEHNNPIRIAGTKPGPGGSGWRVVRGAPGAGLLPAIEFVIRIRVLREETGLTGSERKRAWTSFGCWG